jgi:hypothetical protein
MKLLIVISFIFILIGCSSPTKKNEKYYQDKLCKKLNGITEYVLEDRTRVDCLTSDYAIEVDWAKKWAEGIGQSLYYSYMTGKKPAVALIVNDNDQRYINRLNTIAKKLNIKTIIIQRD